MYRIRGAFPVRKGNVRPLEIGTEGEWKKEDRDETRANQQEKEKKDSVVSCHRYCLLRLVLVLPRKEVIQPQVLLRLPCYDFTPLAKVTLGTFKKATSGTPHSVGVTGGVYNPRVHIHRSMADLRLLAIPAS